MLARLLLRTVSVIRARKSMQTERATARLRRSIMSRE